MVTSWTATNTQYLELFQTRRYWSIHLRDNSRLYEALLQEGYLWIRRLERKHFHQITREPTIGCWVEVAKTAQPGMVSMQSWKAHKLIHKICYF